MDEVPKSTPRDLVSNDQKAPSLKDPRAKEKLPKQYLSVNRLSYRVQVLLGVSILISLFQIGVSIWGASFVNSISNGVKVTESEGNLIDLVQSLLAGINFFVFIGTAITFIAWFSRLRENAEKLGVEGLKSHVWQCTWGFIIPVVALYEPLKIAQEIWKASSTDISGPTDWKRKKGSFLITLWWVFWLVFSAGERILDAANRNLKTPKLDLNQFRIVYLFSSIVECTSIIAALLAIFVVRKLSARQEEKHVAYLSMVTSSSNRLNLPGNEVSAKDLIDTALVPCPICAKEIKLTAKFCQFCGSSTSDNDSVQPVKPERPSESDGLFRCVQELPHFPFANISTFKDALRRREIDIIVRQDGALQWAAGGLVLTPPDSLKKMYRICRFVGGAVPSVIFLVMYSIYASNWWLLLSLPLCWVATFLLDPLMAKTLGFIHFLSLFVTIGLLVWATFSGQLTWFVLSISLLVIWLALKIRLNAVVSTFSRLIVEREDYLCLAWQASWLTISVPSEKAQYAINYQVRDGITTPTAFMVEQFTSRNPE